MANGEVRNKDPEVRHWGIKSKDGGARKSSTPQFHTSDMNSIPNSPSTVVPIADNVPMGVDSDSEAEQAALELAQAQEQVRAANEAQEKHREEQKRQEEERKVKIVAAIKLAAELVVDREQRILLQVSLRFHQL